MARLDEVCTKIGSGATPRGGEAVYTTEGVALIRSQNVLDSSMRIGGIARITDEAARSLDGVTVGSSDVLLNITGESVARCAVVDRRILPARVNQHVLIIRAGEDLDPRYLQSYLVSPAVKSELLGMSSGGTRRALTKGQIGALEVPLPPLLEQRAMAEVLGALDDKIASNERTVSVAEALTTAKVPQGGLRCRIVDVAEHMKKSLSPASLGADLILHYSLPAFDTNRLPATERGDSILSNKFVVDTPVVLLSKLNPRFPRVWDVPSSDGASVASTEFVVLRPREVSTSSLWAVLSQAELGQALVDKASGTSGSHQRVRPQEILDAEIIDPRQFPAGTSELITALGRRVHMARTESQKLAALRDALLPELMSGRLRVKDAEKTVEEVV